MNAAYIILRNTKFLNRLGPFCGVVLMQGSAADLSDSKSYLELDRMFRNFIVSDKSIGVINIHTVLCGQDVRLSTTHDHRVEILRNFMKQHPIVILCVDKSQDIAVISKNSYQKKLGYLFLDNPNFEPIEELSIKT